MRPYSVARQFCFAAIAIFLAAGLASARTDPPETDFREFFPSLGRNFTGGLFSTDNIFPLLIGGVGAAVVHPYDEDISKDVSPYSEVVGETGQIVGGPVVLGVVAGAMIAAPFSGNKRLRAFAFDAGQAYIMNYAVVQSLKYAGERTRPSGEDETSFPSGHSADSFLLATLLNHHYGRKWGIPAYAVAAFVAYSRVEKGKHYPSDVIFGGAIGYVIAKTAIRGHAARSHDRISWLPYAGRGSIGLTAKVNF